MKRDKPESETIPQHQNLTELNHIKKWNYLSHRVFFQLRDLCEELLLVQMMNLGYILSYDFYIVGHLSDFFYTTLKLCLIKFLKKCFLYFFIPYT